MGTCALNVLLRVTEGPQNNTKNVTTRSSLLNGNMLPEYSFTANGRASRQYQKRTFEGEILRTCSTDRQQLLKNSY
jgi:hypothetical protein